MYFIHDEDGFGGALQGGNEAQMYVHAMKTEEGGGMGTFAGDAAALWGSDDGQNPGHQIFGGTDPMIYLRHVYLSVRTRAQGNLTRRQ